MEGNIRGRNALKIKSTGWSVAEIKLILLFKFGLVNQQLKNRQPSIITGIYDIELIIYLC